MHKAAILAMGLLLLLCACNQSAPSSSTSTLVEETTSQTSISEPSSQKVSQPPTSETETSIDSMSSEGDAVATVNEEQAQKEKLITELMEQSMITIKQGEDNYLFCYYDGNSFSNDGVYCRMIFSKYNPDGKNEDADVTIKMEIPSSDGLFYRALEQYGHDMELSYSFERGLVTFTVEKNNYHLNFNDGTFMHEEKYRTQDLDSNYLIETSPDSKLELYATYIDGGGESQWGDYVIRDTETQEIWYLTNYDLYDHTVFCGSNQLMIVRNYEAMYGDRPIEFLDAYTGETLPNAPKFEYGQSGSNEEWPQFFIVGLAYDKTQNKTLIAYREFGDNEIDISGKPTYEVFLAVYDEVGNQINTMNTGYMMQKDYFSFPNHIDFKSADNGTAILSTLASAADDFFDVNPIELGSVSY